MTDVSTPATLLRFTGNWQGSFEGWLPTPEWLVKTVPRTLPGLDGFWMVGQWVAPGGGLPSGAEERPAGAAAHLPKRRRQVPHERGLTASGGVFTRGARGTSRDTGPLRKARRMARLAGGRS